MSKTVNTYIVTLLTATLLSGCALFRSPYAVEDEVAERLINWRPELLAAYYPYEDRKVRPNDVRPIPDYTGWTDNRMAVDLPAMRRCGFSGVMVALTPSQLASADVLERIRRFCDIAASEGLKLTLLLWQDGERRMSISSENLGEYLLKASVLSNDVFIKIDGMPTVFYDSGSIMLEVDGGKYGILFRPVSLTAPSGATSLPVVRVGDSGGSGKTGKGDQRNIWRIPRLYGRELVRQLLERSDEGASVVLVQSWNCYRDGSFTENNSLDGTGISVLLQSFFGTKEEN